MDIGPWKVFIYFLCKSKHGVENVEVRCKSLLHIAATKDEVISQFVCISVICALWFGLLRCTNS